MNPKHYMWCHRNRGEVRLHLRNGENIPELVINDKNQMHETV